MEPITVVLISTLATTGLLALWAALSWRHWFLRTSAFLAVLTPLLFVPAYEPFVGLVTEGLVVVGGIWAVDGFRRRRANSNGEHSEARNTRLRFSMSSLLLATIPFGLAAFVASRLPALNWRAWQSIILIGVGGGVATLAAWWAATGT